MLIFAYLKEIILGIVGFFVLYLMGKNKSLTKKNEELQTTNEENNKLINIQQKVLDVSENVKPTDLDGSLDRLLKQRDK
jgi:hypothetical protein